MIAGRWTIYSQWADGARWANNIIPSITSPVNLINAINLSSIRIDCSIGLSLLSLTATPESETVHYNLTQTLSSLIALLTINSSSYQISEVLSPVSLTMAVQALQVLNDYLQELTSQSLVLTLQGEAVNVVTNYTQVESVVSMLTNLPGLDVDIIMGVTHQETVIPMTLTINSSFQALDIKNYLSSQDMLFSLKSLTISFPYTGSLSPVSLSAVVNSLTPSSGKTILGGVLSLVTTINSTATVIDFLHSEDFISLVSSINSCIVRISPDITLSNHMMTTGINSVTITSGYLGTIGTTDLWDITPKRVLYLAD